VLLCYEIRRQDLIDPVTAFAAATTAFKGIKALVNAGREVEDVTSQIGKWFSAVADYQHAAAEKKKANESGVKKLFAPQSVEQEALEYVMHKKKIREMERDLKNMLTWGNYPSGMYEEMIQARRRIKREREEAVYKKERMKRDIITNIIYFSILGVVLFLTWWVIGTIVDMWPESSGEE
jgi:DNA-binding helix-hairpin-helix protein with protein kinase domain